MDISKDEIIDDLYKMMTSENQTERFYRSKCRGYAAELQFPALCKNKNLEILDGGMFLFRKSLTNFAIYITVSNDDRQKYLDFYDQISKVSVVKKLFFVNVTGWNDEMTTITIKTDPVLKVDPTTLDDPKPKLLNPNDSTKQKKIEVEIHTPKFEIFEYDSGKWKKSDASTIQTLIGEKNTPSVGAKKESWLDFMKTYPVDDVACVYANRFFLDVTLAGLSKGMSDLDLILKMDGKYAVVELKGKVPIKDDVNPSDTSLWSFGWDTRRIAWFLYMKKEIQIDIWYVVSQIDNMRHRNIVSWKWMDIDHFCDCTSWGNEMGTTITAPYTEFGNF